MRARAAAGLVVLLVVGAALAQWAAFPKGTIRIGDRTVTVELARTPAEQAQGLMFRDALPDDEGMLFLYEEPRPLSFWMKNTRIPLSIAFLDAAGAIFQIEDLEPLSERTVFSKKPAQYALEMNRGWFAKRGIDVGAKVDLSPLVRAGLWPPAGGGVSP